MVLGSEHKAHYRMLGPQTTFRKSVSDPLGRYTPVARWRSFCRAQAVLSLLALHKGAGIGPADGFKTFSGPVQLLEYLPVS